MAVIAIDVMREAAWPLGCSLRLLVGSEGAGSLAASEPAGGVTAAAAAVWGGLAEKGGLGADPLGAAPCGYTAVGYGLGEGELAFGLLGVNDWPRRRIEAVYRPADRSATLPVGVALVDPAGNASDTLESVVQLADAPRGVRDLAASATANPNEALLTWTASPDV